MGKISDAIEKSINNDDILQSKRKTDDPRLDALPFKKTAADKRKKNQKSNMDERLVALLKPASFEAEQFKLLRTKLLFPKKGRPPKSIMVTSAVPGEGKTFVSGNLAVSIAQNINEYVLLIDCDIRSPSLHKLFRIKKTPGLSEYLSKGKDLSLLLQRSGLEKLTILSGGNPPSNPSELLSSNKMAQLLYEAKQRYADRYIIIDSPPPQLTSEATALANHVDAVILVVKCQSTKREAVENLIEILGKEKIIGVVANHFDARESSYHVYKKYARYRYYAG